jgi:prepilin-type N-terminal cleavage/methylation domain-containing protein
MNMNRTGIDGQRGFSLVEIMVSLVIGMLILAGILTVYLGNFTSFRLNSQMARLQEDGRFAMNLLEEDLRMAAYAGCVRTGLDFLDTPGAATDTAIGEIAAKIDDPPTAAGFTKEELVQGLAWASSTGLTIYGIRDEGSEVWLYNKDVEKTEFKEQEDPPSKTDADVKFEMKIGKRQYKLDGTTLTRDGTALVENVEAFRVCAGVDADQDETIDSWIKADSATKENWIQTTAVQVDLVLSSEGDVLDAATNSKFFLCGDDTTDESKKVSFPTPPAGVTVATDKKLHKHFHSTVVLRNKAPNGYGKKSDGTDATRAAASATP